jgi:hypothetical protein
MRSILQYKMQDSAIYDNNNFLITINASELVIASENAKIEELSDGQLAVFMHEYWHYIQNISTVAGFKEMVFYQKVLALFSKTLELTEEGHVRSSKKLSEHDSQTYKELWALLIKIRGDNFIDYDMHDVEIVNIDKSETTFLLEGREGPLEEVVVSFMNNRTDAIFHYNFGTIAIFEGIAYELDHFIKDGGVAENNEEDLDDYFPYLVLKKVAEFIMKEMPINRTEIVVIASISLLTRSPQGALVHFLERYYHLRNAGRPVEDGLREICQIAYESYSETVKIIRNDDLPELVEVNKGRFLAEPVWKFLEKQINNLIDLRLRSLIFELEPFDSGNVDKNLLGKLVSNVLPCDVLQRFSGDDDELGRDELFSFGNNEVIWEDDGVTLRISDLRRTLHCQHHFWMSHSGDDGFVLSDDIADSEDSRCPMYASCELEWRQEDAEICRNEPWKTYEREKPGCWYALAVAATLGVGDVKGVERS